MSEQDKLIDWRIDKKPPVMTKKFTFDSYEQTRSFVKDLSDLSEKIDYYPNLTFSQSQATVTIYTDDNELGSNEFKFANQTDEIAELYSQQKSLPND